MKRIVFVAAMLLTVPACIAQTKVATVQIRVLNSRSGKPIKHADTSTIVFPLSPYTTPIERIADRQGSFSLLVPTQGQITVTVSKYASCEHMPKAERDKGQIRLSLQQLFATGVLNTNGCRKRTATLTAGELIVYVRPLHWWERFRD